MSKNNINLNHFPLIQICKNIIAINAIKVAINAIKIAIAFVIMLDKKA